MHPADPRTTRRILLQAAAIAPLAALSGCGFFDTLFGNANHPKLAGKREDIVPVTDGLQPPHGLRPTVTLPPATTGDWPVAGGTISHIAGNASLPPSFREVWSAPVGLGSAYRHQISCGPIVAGGRVFTMDSNAQVSAFDAESGRRLWDLPTRPKKSRSTNIGGGIGYADGTLYVTSGFSELLALDGATGIPRFTHTFNVPIRSAPTPADGLIYFVTVDDVLVAASAKDGHQVWRYEASGADTSLLSHPAPAVADGFVVAGFASAELVACSAGSGAVAWTDSVAATAAQAGITQIAAIGGRPVIVDDIVLALGTAGLMVAEDLRAGRRLWERQTSGFIDPVVAGDFVFITSAEQLVAALSVRTGEIAWLTELPQYIRPKTKGAPLKWTSMTLANGKLIFTSLQHRMVMIDAVSGALEPVTKFKYPVTVPPVVAGNSFYVITDDGRLRAFR